MHVQRARLINSRDAATAVMRRKNQLRTIPKFRLCLFLAALIFAATIFIVVLMHSVSFSQQDRFVWLKSLKLQYSTGTQPRIQSTAVLAHHQRSSSDIPRNNEANEVASMRLQEPTYGISVETKMQQLSHANIHFIHIPKCGGTTMTSLLREIQCLRDPVKNKDCCINPGFCDWHAHRRCDSIKGCINHFPNR